MKILLTNTESTVNSVVGSIDRITSQAKVAFLNAAKNYPEDDLKLTKNIQYLVIFVPYGKDFLRYRANAKFLRTKFFGAIDVFIIDTDQTYKTSVNCRLEYDQVPSTEALTIDYLLDQKRSIKVGDDINIDSFFHKKLFARRSRGD